MAQLVCLCTESVSFYELNQLFTFRTSPDTVCHLVRVEHINRRRVRNRTLSLTIGCKFIAFLEIPKKNTTKSVYLIEKIRRMTDGNSLENEIRF